jgi:hypothetical protein
VEAKPKPTPPLNLQANFPSIAVPPNAFKLELDQVENIAQEALSKIKSETQSQHSNSGISLFV